MNIEIFPAEKSCEQGCSICPLARKNNDINEVKINKSVQNTFSLLEKVLKDKNESYDLHFSSALNLLPSFNNPELIHMARFETNKNIGEVNNPEIFSENIRFFVNDYKINPKVIGFSYVPIIPIVSKEDSDAIGRIINQITSWYFKSTYRKLQVTVRSNLIKIPVFNELAPGLLNGDEEHLKSLICNHYNFYKQTVKPEILKILNSLLYYNEYFGKSGSNKIILINRVIGGSKSVVDTQKSNIEQAMHLAPFKKSDVDFAIAPKGVMLMHSSLAINNPVLWITHKDFSNILDFNLRRNKNFSILKLIEKTILQNIVFYNMVLEESKDVSINQFPEIFERLRNTFIHNKTHHL